MVKVWLILDNELKGNSTDDDDVTRVILSWASKLKVMGIYLLGSHEKHHWVALCEMYGPAVLEI